MFSGFWGWDFSSFLTLLPLPHIPFFHLWKAHRLGWHFYLPTQRSYLQLSLNYLGTTLRAN